MQNDSKADNRINVFGNIFPLAIYVAILVFETVALAYFSLNVTVQGINSDVVSSFRFASLGIFQIITLIILLFSIEQYFLKIKNENKENKFLINLIILYALYQLFVVAPFSYLDGSHKFTYILYSFLIRMPIVLVPYFLWRVIPSFKKIGTPWLLLSASSILLLLAAYINYKTGNILITNTGQPRYIYTCAAIIFGATFLVNFFKEKRTLTNLIFMVTGLIGMVTVNFRSAYIYLALVFGIGLLINYRNRIKIKTVTTLAIIILALTFTIFQDKLLWVNFTERVKSISIEDANFQGRISDWRLAYEHFAENPINGSMFKNEYYTSIYQDHYIPHGFIFEILPTQGVIGLVFYLIFIIKLLIISFRNSKIDTVSFAMFLVLLFYVLFSSFNVTLTNPLNLLVMILTSAVILSQNNKLTHGE